MGFGDELMATGLARGAAARGKLVAFGDGRRIVWGPWSEPVFRYNPNIARPGYESCRNLEWVAHYKGCRLYNSVSADRKSWTWNENFSATAGEVFFSDEELRFAERAGSGFVVVEPNVPWHKSVAKNKDWGYLRYDEVARLLTGHGHEIVQFSFDVPGRVYVQARAVRTPSFRHALAVLSRASLYIGPEGGLHHGAAAVGIPAVVLFGGFIPPSVTGYSTHTNLTGGSKIACGRLYECNHCRIAMDNISINKVMKAATRHLEARSVA